MSITTNKIITVAIFVMVVGSIALSGTVAGTSPSSVVDGVIDSVETEIVNIGSGILFLYALVQIVAYAFQSGGSEAAKKFAVSALLGIVIQSWSGISTWLEDQAAVVVSPPDGVSGVVATSLPMSEIADGVIVVAASIPV
jgi:hypothetical protein